MQARNSMEKHDTEPKVPQKSRSAEWLAIAEAAEAATGPDREIDARIGAALDICHGSVSVREWGKIARSLTHDMLPPYTASLDAITAAAEAAKMDWCASIHSDGQRSRAYVECYVATRPKRKGGVAEIVADHHGDTTTPALALCAAFARAMAERSEG